MIMNGTISTGPNIICINNNPRDMRILKKSEKTKNEEGNPENMNCKRVYPTILTMIPKVR